MNDDAHFQCLLSEAVSDGGTLFHEIRKVKALGRVFIPVRIAPISGEKADMLTSSQWTTSGIDLNQ
jgi:hypothetical protein